MSLLTQSHRSTLDFECALGLFISAGHAVVRDSVFLGNGHAFASFGAISIQPKVCERAETTSDIDVAFSASVTIDDTMFAFNRAAHGAAILLNATCDLTLVPSTDPRRQDVNWFAPPVFLNVTRSVLTDNGVTGNGGAICAIHDALRPDDLLINLRVDNATIARNEARAGGAFFATSNFVGKPVLRTWFVFTSVSHNRASRAGGALHLTKATLQLANQTELVGNCCGAFSTGHGCATDECETLSIDQSRLAYRLPAPPGTWIQGGGALSGEALISTPRQRNVQMSLTAFPYNCPAGFLGWDGLSANFTHMQSADTCAGESRVGCLDRRP